MNRRLFLQAGAAGLSRLAAAPEHTPNIGFIYADDLGYGDLGCHGVSIRYSNDMSPRPLLHATAEKTERVEEPARLETLTPRYTEQALRFIEQSKDSPFFLYMPHTYPHIPLAASDRFRGKSPYGIYGDVVEEIDWSVGQVLGALKKHGLENK